MCGRATMWWDELIKDRINTRWNVYKNVISSPGRFVG